MKLEKIEAKPELIEGLKSIAEGKNVDAEIVVESLKEALITAARKYTQITKHFEVEINLESGAIAVKLAVEVVEDYPDEPEGATPEEIEELDENYMLLDEAREYDPDAAVGDFIEMDIPIDGFGRMAVQTAKQILMQKVRDAERKRIIMDYQDRIGTLVSGEVQQVDRGAILVKIGKTEAVMPPREQIRKERYRQGDSIQAYIADVSDGVRGAQVIVSRAHPQFLVELFKLEVPEIFDGVVEIKSVSRDPGFRAKIAVSSRDERIDPVGACVGMKGNRVQTIVRELSNERIDIVHWTDDLQMLVRRSLAPADIRKLVEVKGTERIVLVIADEDLSQAIGRNGQNVRLASQLTKRNLEIIGESEYLAKSEEQRAQMAQPRETDRVLASFVEAQERRSGLDALFAEQPADAGETAVDATATAETATTVKMTESEPAVEAASATPEIEQTT
jgi:N utilization substance protein A